jgi:hypothetical protein
MKPGWLMGLEPTTTGITIFVKQPDLTVHPVPIENFADSKGAASLGVDALEHRTK